MQPVQFRLMIFFSSLVFLHEKISLLFFFPVLRKIRLSVRLPHYGCLRAFYLSHQMLLKDQMRQASRILMSYNSANLPQPAPYLATGCQQSRAYIVVAVVLTIVAITDLPTNIFSPARLALSPPSSPLEVATLV